MEKLKYNLRNQISFTLYGTSYSFLSIENIHKVDEIIDSIVPLIENYVIEQPEFYGFKPE